MFPSSEDIPLGWRGPIGSTNKCCYCRERYFPWRVLIGETGQRQVRKHRDYVLPRGGILWDGAIGPTLGKGRWAWLRAAPDCRP